MGILKSVLQLLPSVFKLMSFAEIYFSDRPKSGEDKKALVMGATQAMVEGVKEVSTGGQKETWDKLEEPLSTIVDGATSLLFNK